MAAPILSSTPRRVSREANVLGAVLAGAVVLRVALAHASLPPLAQAWATVFVAVCVQATPYVLLGAVVSALLGGVPPAVLRRVVARRGAAGVPMLALAGLALPGCECGAVPIAASLVARGVPLGPAAAFMISAPGANPVVLAATAAAFPGQPRVVAARFAAALLVAMAVGWLANVVCGGQSGVAPAVAACDAHGTTVASRAADAVRATVHALGLLVLGAAAAAAITVLVPRTVLGRVAGTGALGVGALAVLAVVLAVCSQADAFLASSFVGFSRTAQLAFMVVGPAVDVKLIALQAGAFGARVAVRLALLAFGTAVTAAVVVAGFVL